MMSSGRSHLVIAFVVSALGLVSCGDSTSPETECSNRVPIAMVTQTLREQADFVGDISSNSLRDDLRHTIATLELAEASASKEVASSLGVVRKSLESLKEALQQTGWDIANAMSYEAVTGALTDLESADVARANIVVDSYFLQRCGAGAFVVEESSVQTLPTPTGASPSDSEPVTGVVDNDSDARAIGLIVGQLFGLTLDTSQVDCLGSQLQSFVDLSDSTSSASQYQRQFQKAFDACSIDFVVPSM